ncbi:MAG: pyruvate dehydrogenase E1 component subunit beta [Parcubacteria group bacterium GW2011_GWD2_40_9]|nr:MAG: pyruvate dehydrogenase E1 component subunit beta [Parcubacteria group bacterium GW2011_GWD2_40_9]
MGRKISYAAAIGEAQTQAMDKDENVFICGLEADGERGIFGTTIEPGKRFPHRVFDMPLCENGITGFGLGTSLAGMRPIMVHARIDFLMPAMDQIVNHAAKWKFMTGNAFKTPMVIRTIIGRGKGQGAQHAQALHSMFAGVAGLKVVMPANAYDAKGLLISAIEDDEPVIYIEHRFLHLLEEDVPEDYYKVPIGKAKTLIQGTEVTIVAVSHMVIEAQKAALELLKDGISAEVVDLRTIKPIDEETVLNSVAKTGKLIVADVGQKICGVGSEIVSLVMEKAFDFIDAPPVRIGLPDYPVPTAIPMEEQYYPTWVNIVSEARKMMGIRDNKQLQAAGSRDFQGPF